MRAGRLVERVGDDVTERLIMVIERARLWRNES